MHSSRPQFGSSRSVQFRAPGPIAQILSLVIFLAIVAAAFFILIPLAVVLIVVGLIAYAWFRVKLAFRKAREPGGALDERRNVRVIKRDD